ncbi:hypothetical protein PHSY_006545 [Pseudozyma hubeiensis SY62]|uniref:HNH nuclease domain-containing protein n=1 Tax=Pseudozyma hubeiensis (strain SY62) TaxID=1305764 RepID=R9PC09_PSEHS|nr:hypothetical protein PHSY_006545 [Pseudozyma hubeiensis SY62]GAC98948.1 hypothetical protein PHSY_006545 [Pseudozyma hubeiensis SY62]
MLCAPAQIVEVDSVSQIVTTKGVDYEVTVLAVDAHVFYKEKYGLTISKGRCFINGKLASGDFFKKRRELPRFVFPVEIPSSKLLFLLGGPSRKPIELTPYVFFFFTDMVLDHADQRPLNNVRTNLCVVTQSFNTINCTRKKQSKYFVGVRRSKNGKFNATWGKKQLGTFDTARIAKTARILVAREKGKEWEDRELVFTPTVKEMEAAIRGIEKPKRKRRVVGTGGLNLHVSGLWHATFRSKHLGYFKTKEEGQAHVDAAKEEYERKREEEDATVVIPRTKEGNFAYLTALNGEEVLVDDDIYIKMYRNKISVAKDGYPRYLNRFVHRSVLVDPYNTWTHHMDHRNGNKLDNRRANLRIVPIKINAMNITRESKSGYAGVRPSGTGRFVGYVQNTKVWPHKLTTRTFDTAEEAYAWRCALHKQIFPELYD